MALPEVKIEVPGPAVPGPSANTSGKWEAGLCSCLISPCSNCKTIFCACCILKQVANHLGKSGCLWCCCLWPCVSNHLWIMLYESFSIHSIHLDYNATIKALWGTFIVVFQWYWLISDSIITRCLTKGSWNQRKLLLWLVNFLFLYLLRDGSNGPRT